MLGYLKVFMVLFLMGGVVFAHEGHHLALEDALVVGNPTLPIFQNILENYGYMIRWIGQFHLVILHFPIALTVMTVVAEILFFWYRKPVFEQAAYFMIISAAVWAVPTALLGLALSYGAAYQGLQLEIFEWHRYFGSLTVFLAALTAYLRYDYFAKQKKSLALYYISLFFLFISVSLTGVFGGSLAFGYLIST
jgi:uncharacterized membrane protein